MGAGVGVAVSSGMTARAGVGVGAGVAAGTSVKGEAGTTTGVAIGTGAAVRVGRTGVAFAPGPHAGSPTRSARSATKHIAGGQRDIPEFYQKPARLTPSPASVAWDTATGSNRTARGKNIQHGHKSGDGNWSREK